MLRSLDTLIGFDVLAGDGDIGKVEDFYFDETSWHVRYVVVETGSWLSGRRVLVAPAAVAEIRRKHWDDRRLPLDLTREQVRRSPEMRLDKPITRPEEEALYVYYGWPMYWAAGPPVGTGTIDMYPRTADRTDIERLDAEARRRGSPPPAPQQQPHLRSTREVKGYRVQGADGAAGHVDDLLAEEVDWVIHYLVVHTRDILPGRRVLLPVGAVTEWSWSGAEVGVTMTRRQVEESPEYDPGGPRARR